MEEWLIFNGLVPYFEEIKHTKIYKSELVQFFVNIDYQKESTPLITSIVNQKFITITPAILSHWTKLPNSGVILHNFKI